MKDGVILYVRDVSQVADARRATRRLTDSVAFPDDVAGKVAIIVTELATNMIKHTTHGGEIILKALEIDGTSGIEVVAVDRGPGIGNVAEAMRDGFSTAGGSGTGLGAISRMSDVFDIHSLPRLGTVILSRVWLRPLRNHDLWLNRGADAICLPKPGEEVAGDGWSIREAPPYLELMVVDGLGHGPLAAEAAIAAMHVFRTASQRSPAKIIQEAHLALRSTRGAAMATARVDCVRREVLFSGVGNITAAIMATSDIRRMVSSDGVVGDNVYRIDERSYPLGGGSLVVMHSDGITSHWSVADYPGLLLKHPGVIGGVLLRDFARGIDDATALVARPPKLGSYEKEGEGKPAWLS